MNGERVPRPDALQALERRPAGDQVVLGVDLEEAQIHRPAAEDVRQMRRLQPDAHDRG